MNHASLFSGIGACDLAAEWMGWENVFQVEIDPFCTKVLEKNFPNTKRYGDIRTFPASDYAGRIDILTGGFPCQGFSAAGKQKGTSDERYLWPEFLRVIQAIKPTFVLAENVRGILSTEGGLVFEQVCIDLENEGYEVQPIIIPACAVNAPHRRDRVWFIARYTKHNGFNGAENGEIYTERSDSNKDREDEICGPERTSSLWDDAADTRCKCGQPRRREGMEKETSEWPHATKKDKRYCGNAANSKSPECEQPRNPWPRWARFTNSRFWGKQRHSPKWGKNWIEVATELCGMDDGLPVILDGPKLSKSRHRIERLKSLGNSMVPQVVYKIFKAIAEN